MLQEYASVETTLKHKILLLGNFVTKFIHISNVIKLLNIIFLIKMSRGKDCW